MKKHPTATRSRAVQILMPLLGGAVIAGISSLMMWLVGTYIR